MTPKVLAKAFQYSPSFESFLKNQARKRSFYTLLPLPTFFFTSLSLKKDILKKLSDSCVLKTLGPDQIIENNFGFSLLVTGAAQNVQKIDETFLRGCKFGNDFAHIRLEFNRNQSRTLSTCVLLVFSRQSQYLLVKEFPEIILHLNTKKVPVGMGLFENVLFTTTGFRRFSTYLESQCANSTMALWCTCQELLLETSSEKQRPLANYVMTHFVFPPPQVSQVFIQDDIRNRCLEECSGNSFSEDAMYELMQSCLHDMYFGPWLQAGHVMYSSIQRDEQRRESDVEFKSEGDFEWEKKVAAWTKARESRLNQWAENKSAEFDTITSTPSSLSSRTYPAPIEARTATGKSKRNAFS
eukprot:TRINITY_DN27031_c0_g2_i1.p1 TRINITY_DN27031_c0_g2~~TRINITY_DN27031_c0_g2_i1.p1  ORF type:complete len:354 (-),score=77.92 TRINITY_DN27031_c0_g2_i1:48-1109(-)